MEIVLSIIGIVFEIIKIVYFIKLENVNVILIINIFLL